MAATTSFQPGGYPGRPYGSFAGKEASDEPAGPHNPGRITTLWGYGGSGHLHGSFAGKGESDEPAVEPPAASSEQPAGRSPLSRRKRHRIIAKVDGELIEVSSVEELFRLLHSVKKEIPEVAKTKAEELLRSGRKIGEARKTKSIEIIEAPSRAREAIEDRIDEMHGYYWMLVQRNLRLLEDDDEVFFLIH